MSRDEAVALVQRILDGDYSSDAQLDGWLATLARELGCIHVSDLIFWPGERELSAAEVVDHALTCQPIAL